MKRGIEGLRGVAQLVLVLAVAWAVPARGAVLCQKRSGVAVVRTACKKKEVPVDVASLGLRGPRGERGLQGDPGSKGDPGVPGVGPLTSCPADAILAGTTCVDKYEASVWRVPGATGVNQALVTRIQTGVATAAELTFGGATQLGLGTDNYAPCDDSGQNCADDIFAVSLPAVTPSSGITWFQAQAACENARKRLPSNAEWQAAVMGTPDPGADNGTTDCQTANSFTPTNTGSRTMCVSSRGAFDMVGNLNEWVAD